MAEEFKVSCPKCGIVFSVPMELSGEMAECSECDAVFEIPAPLENSGEYVVSETGTFKGVDAPDADSHNTVKLTRTSIGMIPTLKSGFEVGTKSLPGRGD